MTQMVMSSPYIQSIILRTSPWSFMLGLMLSLIETEICFRFKRGDIDKTRILNPVLDFSKPLKLCIITIVFVSFVAEE